MNKLKRFRRTDCSIFFFFLILASPYSVSAGVLCPEAFDRPPRSAKTEDHFSTSKVSASFLHLNRNTNFVDLNLTWLRSNYDGVGLPDQWISNSRLPKETQQDQRIFAQTNRQQAIADRNQALDNLYRAYGNQGPERSSQLHVYQSEDVSKASRTSHLTITSLGETIAHLQYQTSDSPDQRLNLEDHFEAESAFIRGSRPDQPVTEMGRLEILKKNEAKVTANRELLSYRSSRDFIFYTLWSEVLLDIESRHSHDSVVFQVNNNMLEKLELYFFKPTEFKNKKKVILNPDLPAEWLVKLSPAEVKTLAKVSVQKRITLLIDQYLAGITDPDSVFMFSASPKSFGILEELGVYSAYRKTMRRQTYNFWRRRGFSNQEALKKSEHYTDEKAPIDPKITGGEHTIGLGLVEARELQKQWKEHDQTSP